MFKRNLLHLWSTLQLSKAHGPFLREEAGRAGAAGEAPPLRPAPPLLGTRSASPAAASHPITRGAQSRRLKEGPSFEIALILVKWQRPLKITLS